jgi:Clp amino terminal domain, pathogenicity island component
VSARARTRFGMGRVYLDALAEARRRGDRRVGTDHIALAMLCDPDSNTARALGFSLDSARTALQTLDSEALATLGIDAPFVEVATAPRTRERLSLTPAGRAIFTGLRRVAAGERLGPKHVLLALLGQQRPDPAAELFDALGVDRDVVRARLAPAL